MLKVNLRTIPHSSQRYDTVGDWQFIPPNELLITVSEMGDWRMEMLVALHELIECLTCQVDGVSQKAVDLFDMNFKGEGEPGEDPLCPYFYQHLLATDIERRLAYRWAVNWNHYDKVVNSLVWRPNDGERSKTTQGKTEEVNRQPRNRAPRRGKRKVMPDGGN